MELQSVPLMKVRLYTEMFTMSYNEVYTCLYHGHYNYVCMVMYAKNID